jgi:propionyl-CoA carboxylase beta chain
VITPHGTRKRLARALAMLRHRHIEWPWWKHDNFLM